MSDEEKSDDINALTEKSRGWIELRSMPSRLKIERSGIQIPPSAIILCFQFPASSFVSGKIPDLTRSVKLMANFPLEHI